MQNKQQYEAVVIGSGQGGNPLAHYGVEFAQMFRRFGARVTLVQHANRLLPREDHDLSEALNNLFVSLP